VELDGSNTLYLLNIYIAVRGVPGKRRVAKLLVLKELNLGARHSIA